MAYYRLSTVVKMKRHAIGAPRNAFDNEGLSEMTVYRMEKGKRTSGNSYRKLTASLGMQESTQESVFNSEDIAEIILSQEIQGHMARNENAKAEELIRKLWNSVDVSDRKNRQYLLYCKSMLEYRYRRISSEEYEDILYQLLNMRIPKKYPVDLYCWPLHSIELQTLISLDTVLQARGKFIEQMENAKGLLKLMDSEYTDSVTKTSFRVLANLFLARGYGNLGQFQEALDIDHRNIQFCMDEREFGYIVDIYYDIHWNYWELKKIRPLTEEEEEECKQSLLKAFYTAKSRRWNKPLYEKRLLERYPEEVE